MSNQRRVLAALASSLLVVLTVAPARGDGGDTLQFQKSLDRAKSMGMAVVLEFHADWCAPCKQFEARVLPDPEVKKALEQVVFVRVDVETPAGVAIQERYGVGSLPTFLTLDGSGLEVGRTVGLGSLADPAAFVRHLEAATLLGLDEGAIVASTGEGASATAEMDAARWYAARNRRDNAAEHYRRAAAADRDPAQRIAAEARWHEMELALAKTRRDTTLEASLDYARQFPTSEHCTSALSRLAYSGSVDKTELAPLLHARITATDDPRHLLTLVYASIETKLPSAAQAAATRLMAVEPAKAQSYVAVVDGLLAGGLTEQAATVAADCPLKVEEQQRPRCERLSDRLNAGDSSPLAALFRRNAQAFFVNLETPGGSGELARSSLRQQSLKARYEAMAASKGVTMKEMTADRTALADLFKNAGVECGGVRGHLHRASVRVTLSSKGGRPTDVEVLEPTASRRLRVCLDRTLSASEFPRPSTPAGERTVVEVRLREAPDQQFSEDNARLSVAGYGRYDSGFASAMMLGARGVGPLFETNIGVMPSGLAVAEVGVNADGDAVYDVSAMAGFGVYRSNAFVGVFGGVGVSGSGDRIPFALHVPIELTMAVRLPSFGARAWLRPVLIPSEEERQDGAINSPLDEVAVGLGVTIPTRLARDIMVGFQYQERMEQELFGVFVGAPITLE